MSEQPLRLASQVERAVQADRRRIVVIGARGWIGRVTLALLRGALGPEFADRVVAFGSSDGEVALDDGLVPQRGLERLVELAPRPTLVLHLAFLTKDKVAGMAADDYAARNRALSTAVFDALDVIGADRLFVASSGAAAVTDPDAAADLQLYGLLKREDEERAADWAVAAPERRAAIGRIYSVSGPYINKPDTYALASFILDALAGRPIEVRAPMPVLRSYVAVREVIDVVLATLLAADGEPVLRFATGGVAHELGDVAAEVARTLGGTTDRRPITEERENRYVGDAAGWAALLARHGLAHLPLSAQVSETARWLARPQGG